MGLSWDEGITRIRAKKGDDWLCPPLVQAFCTMYCDPSAYRAKFHSFDLWLGNELVACELGMTCSSRFCSALLHSGHLFFKATPLVRSTPVSPGIFRRIQK